MGNPFDLSGQTALVTGGNVGLGQAIALALAEAGANIVSTARRPSDDTGAKVRALDRKFLSIEADLATTAPIASIVEHTLNAFGKIDILVNNAGIIRRADSVEFTEEDWDAVIDTNLKSAFFLAQACGRHMIAQGRGKIINIASMLSFQGGIRVPSYTASKSGLAGITRLLACEWAGKGINVNAIAPGYMTTDNTEALRADKTRNQQILDRIPAGRWGDASDLGGAAVFLASAASDYVHGAIIPVDGGWLAR
ncbi:MAG: 2-dehydro-3-deoxy-D-gluconate 5-dehydrogenase KduD [Hyphomonadaceae bacterium]